MKKPHQRGRIRLGLFGLRWRRLGLLGGFRRKARYLGGFNVGGALTRGIPDVRRCQTERYVASRYMSRPKLLALERRGRVAGDLPSPKSRRTFPLRSLKSRRYFQRYRKGREFCPNIITVTGVRSYSTDRAACLPSALGEISDIYTPLRKASGKGEAVSFLFKDNLISHGRRAVEVWRKFKRPSSGANRLLWG